MSNNHTLTIRNIGCIFISSLLFLGVLIFSASYYSNLNLNSAEKIWGDLDNQKSERNYILNNIVSGLGYGGMIHNFKNYIIRGESDHWNNCYINFGETRSLLLHYKSLPQSKGSNELLKPIISMLDAYDAAINKAADLRNKGVDIKTIDAKVRVSDAAALTALSRLIKDNSGEQAHTNKQHLLNQLKTKLGYGGMIHSFKNYILRSDAKDMFDARRHASNAREIIERYMALDLSYREELSLSKISAMVDAYSSMLDNVRLMHDKNIPIPSIDKFSKYDDEPSLRSFEALQKAIVDENSNSSMKLIRSLTKVRNITSITGYLSISIVLFLVLFLARYYYSRILGPISKITINMKELANGHVNESLPIPRVNDEIAEMIQSIEVFRRQAQDIQAAEKRFELLFDASPFGLLAVSEDGRIIMANAESADMFGYSQAELLELPLDELVPFSSRSGHSALRNKFNKDGSSRKMNSYREVYAEKKGGQTFPVEINLSPINLNNKKIILCAVNDISFRKKSEHELQKLSKSVERSPNLVLITDAHGSIEYVNNSFTSTTGYFLEDILGKKPSILSSGKTAPEVYENLWKTIQSGKEWRGELLNKKKNNEFFWASHTIFPIKNDENKITTFVSLFEDISKSKKTSDELAFRANHDLLTGLKSRHFFENKLLSILEEKSNNSTIEGAVCFIDLDQFKVINDTSGHVAGDELLKQISLVLIDMVRKEDLIARFGGDEFVILMENCPADKSIEIAEKIRSSIERIGFSWEGIKYATTCSIGVVQYSQNNNSLIEIMKRVDAACYVAKDNGRNSVHAAFEMDDDITNRQNEMHWLSDIAAGLVENKFKLFAQSIEPVNCCGKGGDEYEVLIRYQDESGAIIPPGAFLPAAERYQQAEKIDSWVINTLFHWISENRNELSHIGSFAINLSGQSLGSSEILKTITEGFQYFDIAPSLIKFEVTETAAVANLPQAIKFIDAIKSYGCKFSLDDFGSGLSSFAYLKSLPVDILKIDGMFVKNILNDKIDYAMVKMINEIGHVMGMETVAEFVENDEILAKIRELGVNYAQGYGIEKPIPINEIRRG